jgi:hypothetical protein
MATVNVTVLVEQKHAHELNRVASSLDKAGMKVKDVLDAVGIVTGKVDERKLSRLRSVLGVQSVELEQGMGVPSPDSEIQ